ncbi:TOTE conflict system archaeo-eukaryotic primase domain-containing protein [Mycobacterium sp. MAC_080597_8934]|uniref:TOTE conflict system archaeo-eukaryotic primase domain-containing protein n=1 Tax=Mycobacterium sp. MAC_080597_8934 TaxID=1335322 RepID=UPI003A521092
MGSSSAHKVRFFFDLFRCRTDVYALRWENRRDGRSGWMPAIKGSWRKGMNRADAPYLPLTLRSLMPTCEAKHISACTHSAMTTPVNGQVEVPAGGQQKSPLRCGWLANSWRLPSCGRRGASGRTRRR